MEDDHETQSQTSASPNASPSPNGRITVTVASSPRRSLSPPEEKDLALALPVQQPQKPNGGGREDCWSEGATAVLIEAWGERYLELSRGNLKQKHWKEVADIVSSRDDYAKTPKTDIQCKNRIDTVKKKYKLEKAKISTGGAPSRWVFFNKLDHLIGTSAKTGPNSSGGGSSAKVPVGIPVGVRTAMSQFRANHGTRGQDQKQKTASNKKTPSRKRALMDSDEDEDEDDEEDFSADSMDSLPPPPPPTKKMMKIEKEIKASPKRDNKKWGCSMRELTQAILRFGEAYEAAESAKLQQVVEMEKQRMKFAKDLELQRMQFFMKTQLEISQLKHHGKTGGGGIGHASSNHHHHHGNVNNSESSS